MSPFSCHSTYLQVMLGCALFGGWEGAHYSAYHICQASEPHSWLPALPTTGNHISCHFHSLIVAVSLSYSASVWGLSFFWLLLALFTWSTSWFPSVSHILCLVLLKFCCLGDTHRIGNMSTNLERWCTFLGNVKPMFGVRYISLEKKTQVPKEAVLLRGS